MVRVHCEHLAWNFTRVKRETLGNEAVPVCPLENAFRNETCKTICQSRLLTDKRLAHAGLRGRCYSGSMSRVASGIFFILSGIFMSSMVSMGWGYWYLGCGILWTLSGFVWIWRPSWGASFGAFPVVGIAGLMAPLFVSPYRRHLAWSPIFWFYGFQMVCLAIALVLIIATIRKTSVPSLIPRIISFSLVFGSFFMIRALVDRHVVKSYQMYVAMDGKGPQGLTDPPWDGPDVVVLYRRGRNGVICFDAFHSNELHDFLFSKNGQPVTVEYDTFSDFGKVRGYNVRSVDRKILANGYHLLKPEFGSSAGSTSTGEGTTSGDDCW